MIRSTYDRAANAVTASYEQISLLQKFAEKTFSLFLLYGLILCSSAFLFSWFEHKEISDSFWWASVTSMTVGYGDIAPMTLGGRIVGGILMHVVPLFIIPLITANMAAKLIVDHDAFTHDEQESIKTDIAEIKRIVNELALRQ